MTVGDGILASIDSVDDFAEELYCRSDAAGPDFVDLRTAIHNLQNAFNDLHAEASDPDSLINGRNGAYLRRLTLLLEDSDVTLKQAKTLLGKYDGNSKSNNAKATAMENLDSAEKAKAIELVRAELVSQKLKIYNFLETVEIHNPRFQGGQTLEGPHRDHRRETIQNKVDSVANRIFRRRRQGSPVSDDAKGDELWQEFQSELVKEGFDHEVLHKNKDVLAAYIRDLESHRALEDGAPPSVRGLLECGSSGPAPGAGVPTYHPMPNGDPRPNDQVPVSNERRRRAPPESLQISTHLQPPAISIDSSQLSYERFTPSNSSDSSDTESSPISQDTALISTQELLALDQLEADKMASRMGMHGPPPNYISPGTSPVTRYRPLPPAGAPQHEKGAGQYPGTTSHYNPPPPPPPPPPYSSSLSPTFSTPPPPYPLSPTAPSANFNLTVSRISPTSRQYSQLAPDGRGNGIPMDATWTKIKRTLVSPVVLERAGVRYEARPDFVAVLGKLTHEEIAEFARQTLEERSSRVGSQGPALANKQSSSGHSRPRTFADPPSPSRTRGGGRSKHDDDHDSAWGRGDWSEDERDYRHAPSTARSKYTPSNYNPNRYMDQDPRQTRAYPFIVSPPASINGDSKPSPSSTVDPKPILKNRNPNKVHFDKHGPREIYPGTHPDNIKERGKARSDQRHKDDRERERDQHSRGNRDRPRDRDRDRDRDRERESREHHRSHRHRDRDGDGRPRRSQFKDTASAIGLGSAAATLISVLSEAVQHL